MPTQITYRALRERLDSILHWVASDGEVVIVRRPGTKMSRSLQPMSCESLLETAHLLRSPKNAERLLGSLQRALKGEGRPETIRQLRRRVGLATPDEP